MKRVTARWDLPPGTVECSCKMEYSSSFRVLTDHYCASFIPEGRYLLYETLMKEEAGRVLYLTGHCFHCHGQMRSGESIAGSLTGTALLSEVYHKFIRYTPYAYYDASKGQYLGGAPQRLAWYLEQRKLLEHEKELRFLAMFHEKDRPYVEQWWHELRVPDECRCCGNCSHSHGALPFASPNTENGCDCAQFHGPLYTAAMRSDDWNLGHCCRFWSQKGANVQ